MAYLKLLESNFSHLEYPEYFNLRFQKASGQLENTARERQVRRDIARVKTVLLERLSPKQ